MNRSCAGTRMASGIAARYADAFRCNARKRRPDCERPLLHQASASGQCNCASLSSRSFQPSPLLCGLHTGVVSGLRPRSEANARVFSAMWPETSLLSHSISAGAFKTSLKRCSTAASMTSHTAAAMTNGRCCPTRGLAVTAVMREGHAQRLTIVAAEIEAVRTLSLVALRHSHVAVVSALDARPRIITDTFRSQSN
ncbi:hypothetical protein B0G82_7846 [Paraburkholderia sp. BL17N1]|nr:hypothetical protein B0G82_7846 [Paraburkholderia sp. BL17N1]